MTPIRAKLLDDSSHEPCTGRLIPKMSIYKGRLCTECNSIAYLVTGPNGEWSEAYPRWTYRGEDSRNGIIFQTDHPDDITGTASPLWVADIRVSSRSEEEARAMVELVVDGDVKRTAAEFAKRIESLQDLLHQSMCREQETSAMYHERGREFDELHNTLRAVEENASAAARDNRPERKARE